MVEEHNSDPEEGGSRSTQTHAGGRVGALHGAHDKAHAHACDPCGLSASQRTLKKAVELRGVGLFTAQEATVRLLPAGAGSGIVFRRTDLPGAPEVEAHVEHAIDLPRRTGIRKGEAHVETVEHLLASLSGLGIDNAVVELDAPEVPILDGSGADFVAAILDAGTEALDAPRTPLVVREPITLRDGNATISAFPSEGDGFEVLYMLDYGPGAPIPRQVRSFVRFQDDFVGEVAPARTFSSRQEAEAARAMGLFAHMTPSDMLVFDADGPIDNTLRFPDEPVRHKLLDVMGDLALAGRPIQGRIVGVRSGHALNRKLAAALLSPEANASKASQQPAALDVPALLSGMPGRYPVTLVDRVLENEGGRRAVGLKNVTLSDPFFNSVPGAGEAGAKIAAMPGVLILEAMAQLARLMLCAEGGVPGSARLIRVERASFQGAVSPGDQLVLEAKRNDDTGARETLVECVSLVDGVRVAEAVLVFQPAQ